jgi:hypothetical protein
MEWLGLAPSQLAGVGALAAAAVVALYLLKQRRRRVAVPFAPLWARVLEERPSAKLFERLRRLLSLLLQLVLLALMVVALGDPRPVGAARRGRTTVLLLDASASMAATDVPGGRAEAARAAARRAVRAMGPDDRMLVAQMDAEVTALTPLTDDATALEAAVAAYRPRDTGVDLGRALRFAGDALHGASGREVVVVSDGAYGPVGEVALGGAALRFVGVGRRGRNLGLTAFSARRYPLDRSRCEAIVELQSWSDRVESVVLTVSVDGAPVERARLRVAPGERVQRVIERLSGGGDRLEARLAREDGTRDDLPVDDVAFATLPERRRARVLTVGNGNRYLEAALLLDEYLEVVEATPATAAAALAGGRFDVVISDGVPVTVPPGVGWIALRPPADGSPRPVEPGFFNAPGGGAIGFDRVDRRHPVTRFTSDLEEAHIGRVARYRLAPGDRVLGAGGAGPLLVAGEREGGRFVLFTFDVRESDVPLLVSWPVMLINAIDWFSGEDGAFQSSYRTGTAWRMPVPAGEVQATVETPSGQRVRAPVSEGRAVFFGTEAGFHRLHAGDAHTLVAGNLFDPDESACAPRATLTVGAARATAPPPGRPGLRREWWVALLAAAALIVVVEWATWHRRVTV